MRAIYVRGEAQRKRVLNARRGFCHKLDNMNPKPSELTMARVRSVERRMEARTREPFNTLGRAVVRSEKLNELGNSWFSPK